MQGKPLSNKHAAFVAEYRSDRNASRAYTAIYGTSSNAASACARKLLRNAQIRAEIDRLDSAKAEKLEIDTDELLLQALDIVLADPRDLIEYRVGACRYCHGFMHLYQWTQGERIREELKFEEGRLKKAPDFTGGIGFDPRKPPHANCPECAGFGLGTPVLKDTSSLSPRAAKLYAGVKVTKDGLQVLMHDKLSALEKLFRHVGAYEKDNKQKNTPLGQALQDFAARLHAESSGRLDHVPQAGIRRIK